MRHRNSVKKLGRTASHRKATMANLSAALFEQKHIQTTEAKAKATRSYSEKLITLAKKETLHAKRLAFKKLKQRRIVKILFEEIAPRYVDRAGGYTRVVKLGQRLSDGAPMAVIELVGYETASKKKKEKEKAKEKEKEAKTEIKKKKHAKTEDSKKEPEAIETAEVKEKKEKKKILKKKSDIKEKKTESESGQDEKKVKSVKDQEKKKRK